MSVNVEILPDERLQLALYAGTITPGDVDRHWQILQSVPRYRFDYDEIIAYGYGADLSSFSFEFAKSEAVRFLEAHDILPMRSCIVCSDPRLIPMSRLYLAYVRAHGPKHIEFDHFLDVHSALAWINSRRAERQDRKPVGDKAVKRALAKLGAQSLWHAGASASWAAGQ